MDSQEHWWAAIGEVQQQAWFKAGANGHWADVVKHAKAILAKRSPPRSIGSRYLPYTGRPASHSRWYRHNAEALTMHEARSHMRSDLWRYFFCASYASVRGESPKLRDFPRELLPAHKNVSIAVTGQMFGDRFRVQSADQPSSTLTSHIAKDGHYFIHYDPVQCRSLTAREAARLQTFPDSYFFEGGRTEQFHQIGNAVPPMLAREIAAIVYDLLKVATEPNR
jgi:DNA (cytosine-5)-methyltransferase 1